MGVLQRFGQRNMGGRFVVQHFRDQIEQVLLFGVVVRTHMPLRKKNKFVRKQKKKLKTTVANATFPQEQPMVG